MDVVAERLERRDVDDFGLVGEGSEAGAANERVDADEERRQRFAGAGGRGDQDVAAVADERPALDLRLGRGAQSRGKPFGNQGIERRQRVHYFYFTAGWGPPGRPRKPRMLQFG